jgi:hypothetical protein
MEDEALPEGLMDGRQMETYAAAILAYITQFVGLGGIFAC